MIRTEKEVMNEVFDKYHIIGLPFDAVIHHFKKLDTNPHIHDHPFPFTTHILKGGYTERIYSIYNESSWSTITRTHSPGTSHRVESDAIHEIIDFPEGECWTLILPEPKVKQTMFYNFTKEGIYSRLWNENDFTKHKI